MGLWGPSCASSRGDHYRGAAIRHQGAIQYLEWVGDRARVQYVVYADQVSLLRLGMLAGPRPARDRGLANWASVVPNWSMWARAIRA